ncbi:putative THO complex component (Rlr1) [Aspergillus affinis]|uniref:putative THO complex component (Rlr1) n=1 Tax=Aspergillus affinis TaxID=1070780 RepID=UPI0022FE449F|nr:uncharacterized protein KD926_001530 [Aspergillus affinis]KAI9044299.1 hypothetical protein KD926_001530 [Aspergillus affinis]
MAPGVSGKRKRGDRSWSGDSSNDSQRPSPHRPGNLTMAQHNHGSQHSQSRDHSDTRGRGRRQSSRGGRNNPGRRASGDSQNPVGGRRDAAMSPPTTTITPASNAAEQNQTNGVSPAVNQSTQPPSPAPTPSQSQSQMPTPVPSQSLVSPITPIHHPPTPPPQPYVFEYVTDSNIEHWVSTGERKFVDDGVQARKEQDIPKLALIYQELIRSAFYGRVTPTEAGAAVRDIVEKDAAAEEEANMEGDDQIEAIFDPPSLFLDTLSIMTDSDTSNPALKPLVFSTGISAALMRLQLDTPLLQTLGLVRETFTRMGIRKQTNLLYRQSNYNLLREESEGYSKLLTELFTTSNNEPPSSEVVEDTFERVKAMVGAFDMDVGRVLDVTLDVFAAVLVKQYRFFVKLLRASSWWPKDNAFGTSEANRDSGLPNWALPGSSGWATTEEERAEAVQLNEQRDQAFWARVREIGIRAFFEIGRRPVSEEELRKILPESNSLSEEEIDTRKWIEVTGTSPPQGSRVAAQLLGFKLRFYSSRARSKVDVLPDNLIYLAALLIKVGFISLRDLYPHLWRPDDSMDVLKEEKLKEKADRERAARPGGGVNALMMAGALSDDTLSTPRLRESETPAGTPGKDQDADKSAAKGEENDLPEPSDQKVLLLKSLLTIGALPESLFILSKFPWLMDVYPELPEYIHRILHQCLSKVYTASCPSPLPDETREPKQIPGQEQGGGAKGHIRLIQAPPRRVLRWAQLDKEDTNDGTDYRFYWDDWADNIPICHSVDDVFALCSSFLNLSGHKVGHDPTLLTKLARIGKHSMTQDDSAENASRWRDLCKRLLLPAISLTKANPGVVNEVFDLISFFPRDTRYNMYAEWYSGQTSRLPDIKAAVDQAKAETKDVLKRLSKTNIRSMARALAKIACANPAIVIHTAISQIESYENLIVVVVECARYFTNLGYDVLSWALISSLGSKGRNRLQESGLSTSRWLNALANFAGKIFRRYSMMDPTPLLQYVVEQLRHNNSTDLIVLEQLIVSMAGIVSDTSFNDAQIQAMAGGEILQSLTIQLLLDTRHDSHLTARRLIKSLTVSKLAGQLLIAIAQERWTCVFRETEGDAELKLLGNIFDEIHRVFTQYLDLLRSNLTVEEFDSFVPDLASLISDYGVQPEIAFWIRRPSIARKIADTEKLTQDDDMDIPKESSQEKSPSKGETDKMDTADEGEAEPAQLSENSMEVDKEEVEKTDNDDTVVPVEQGPVVAEPPPLNPVMQDLQDQVKSALPSEAWETIGLSFYTTFWQLSLYDVHIPQKAYEDEIERQKKKVILISSDRTDISVSGTLKKEAAKKTHTQLQEQILEENKGHLKSYGRTRAKLQKEKDLWFAHLKKLIQQMGAKEAYNALHVSLLEQCFLPRMLISSLDAFYSFKVLKFLHSSGTPNFRTMGILDQLFSEPRLNTLIFLCTSREADNLGRFLNEVLRDLSRWHADRSVYEKEAFGTKKDLPGFAKQVNSEGTITDFLDYEDFRRLMYKWHRYLAMTFKACFNGGEYMHIRNGISVLKAIVQHFPAVNWIGRDMLNIVTNLSQTDDRDDVKIPAASLIGDLNRREKKWMLPQAFHMSSAPQAKGNVPKTDGRPGTSRPQSTTPTLNASAVEFKPPTNESQTEAPTAAEVEDGEIEDAKMTDAAASRDTQKADDSTLKQTEQTGTTPSQADSTAAAPSSGEGQTSAIQEGATTAEKSAASSLTTDNRSDTGPASRPRAPSADSRGTSRGLDHNRPASIPKRPDVDRISSTNQAVRSQTHTPSRPYREETRLPPRPDLLDDRRDRNAEFRGGRFGNDHDYNRSFDQSPGDGRNYGRLEREYPRGPMEEPFRAHPYREGRPPLDGDWHDRSGRLRTSDARSGPPTHPDRVDMIHEHGDQGYRRGDPPRPERDDRRPLPPARTSPQRVELPNRPERFPTDDRRSLNYPPGQSRLEELPTGPRSDRHGRAPLDGTDSRDPGVGPDLNHGRLRQPDAPADIPLGPRGRNTPGRGGRNASNMPHAPASSGPPAERQPPTGPGRQGMRGAPDPNPTGGPSAAAEKLEATGMHPDRLKAFQQQDGSGGGGGGGAYSGPPRPPQSQPPVAPPSGPRSALGPPSGPSSLPRGPAPGAGFGGERGRGDKRFAGINNMLQQSGGPPDRGGSGPPIRGRGANRQANASPQTSRQLTPVGAADDGGRSGSFQNKPDLLANRPSTTHADDDSSHRSRRGEATEEGSESRRSARYSTGGSGGHSHDRGDRERERDRRGGDEEGTRSSSRREEYRDRNRDYERERSRRGDTTGAGGSREERYESREVARRGAGSREDNRRRRDRDDGAADSAQGSQEHEGRLRPPSFGGQTAPASGPNAEEDRRWSGRDRSSRDRPRDRDYHREGGSGGGGGPHRKRGRPGGDEGNHGDGGGRGGMRTGGETKRPRRGA